MALTVLQWNINGYVNNYNELLILLKLHKPKIISLQETHITLFQQFPIPVNFKIYNTTAASAKGGVALLIHKSVQHKQIPVGQAIETIGFEIQSQKKLNIFSAYIPPSQKFTKTDIETTIPYLTTPTLITGDFNGWNSLWGSPKSNRRGRILGDYIHSNNYIILNNGQPTHLSTHNSYTHIDLAFCSPNLKIHCDFKIMDTSQGSDHFPIIINIFAQE